MGGNPRVFAEKGRWSRFTAAPFVFELIDLGCDSFAEMDTDSAK
jgi:hypothetical protein